MSEYYAPVKDMQFVLNELVGLNALCELPGFEEASPDVISAVLDEAAKLAGGVLSPLNVVGDQLGSKVVDGQVLPADGFKAAYHQFVEGGWPALGGDINYGGMGMPKMITAFHEEMLCSADISFSLYPGLTAGAGLSIAKHGSEELKERYLTRLYTGEWTASMCLTEAHAGTDLGMIRTKAIPQDNGCYLISGSKMFITAGEHDLADNILHLVLAKLPDAPEGSRGISMFLVPKFKINHDDSLGDFNQVTCGSIEHKMGIHASATCVMNFDGAEGYLVGEVNKGLAAMFTMMNFERIGVGIQGIGAAVRSYQNAVEYAKERLQSRALSGVKSPDKPADSLMVHGDVRRMLLNMKSLTEGSRALSAYISLQLDIATYGEGEAQSKAESLVALMTPLAKAFFTDVAFDNTVAGQQVFGGHGYIREWGQEQLVRDCRIAQIYEGTNGIQAMDLIARKVAASKGQLMQVFIDEVNFYLTLDHPAQLAEFISPLASSITKLAELTDNIVQQSAHNPEILGTAANDYLHCFGYVAMAYTWALMAEKSIENLTQDSEFYQAKLKTARYYFTKILPRIDSLILAAKVDADVLFDLTEDEF